VANLLIMLRDPGDPVKGMRVRLHDPIDAWPNGHAWPRGARLGPRLRLSIPAMSVELAKSFCVPWDKQDIAVPLEPDGSLNMIPHRMRLWSFEWDLVPDNLRAIAHARDPNVAFDVDLDPHFIIDTNPNGGDKTWATPSGMRQYFRNKDSGLTAKDLGITLL